MFAFHFLAKCVCLCVRMHSSYFFITTELGRMPGCWEMIWRWWTIPHTFSIHPFEGQFLTDIFSGPSLVSSSIQKLFQRGRALHRVEKEWYRFTLQLPLTCTWGGDFELPLDGQGRLKSCTVLTEVPQHPSLDKPQLIWLHGWRRIWTQPASSHV